MQPGPSVSAAGSPHPAPMPARQCQEHTLERVAATDGVRVANVVKELGILEMTVRRDITELVTQGLVERVHGGAVAAGPTTLGPRFTAKSTLNLEAKRRIGQATAAMVRPGGSLALSAGTTTPALVQALTELEHFPILTVITNSLPATQVLFDAADAAHAENRDAPTVVITGGERTPSNALMGLVAIDALSTMRVEWVFLGTHGFTPEAGLMTPNLQEAPANQALAAAERTVVATLNSSKWRAPRLRSFCVTRDIGVLVTEAEPDADGADALQQAGTRLTIATWSGPAGLAPFLSLSAHSRQPTTGEYDDQRCSCLRPCTEPPGGHRGRHRPVPGGLRGRARRRLMRPRARQHHR